MGKGSKIGGSKSASHRLMKDKAKNRVDDLQGMFSDLQSARRESRTGDVAVLEEQVHQMLREWKAELNEPTPASSLNGSSENTWNLSSDIRRLLHVYEEEDDATSVLTPPKVEPALKPEPEPEYHVLHAEQSADCNKDYGANQVAHVDFKDIVFGEDNQSADFHFPNNLNISDELGYEPFDLQHALSNNLCGGFDESGQYNEDPGLQLFVPPEICPPPSAFMGPKCALWDCNRPAQGTDYCSDYCSTCHADLAAREGPPGMSPIVRPGGIELKDGPLFGALIAKSQGKAVGIPECEGAATSKSPWNAPELFNLSVHEGESIREWLFFDKPRRAFESGSRKQRSLPDYSGRGWHESRKQVMDVYGGLKRSYYMDPQPLQNYEWHLYEYEINNCDACALYRLEFKRVDAKKNPRGKAGDAVVDLQQQMGKLTAEIPLDNKKSTKGRSKGQITKFTAGSLFTSSQVVGQLGFGDTGNYGYFIDDVNEYGN